MNEVEIYDVNFFKEHKNQIDDYYFNTLKKQEFINHNNKIHALIVQTANAQNQYPLVIIPGRAECEYKYAELCYNLYKQNIYAIVVFVRGQGHSSRVIKNSQKCHIDSFTQYTSDLSCFMQSLNIDKYYLLTFSMGGLIGLNYIKEFNHKPISAAFLAPFIFAHVKFPDSIVRFIAFSMGNLPCTKTMYVPQAGDYKKIEFEQNYHSHEIFRYNNYHDYYAKHPNIALGGVTYGFLLQSIIAQDKLYKRALNFDFRTLFIGACQDQVVSTDHIEQYVLEHTNDITKPEFIVLSDCFHDILNEADKYRSYALKKAFNFIFKE